MTLVAPKSQIRAPWQYTGQPAHTFPAWVTASTRWTNNDLFVKRSTGDQLVNVGEWLLKDPDSRDPEWVTDAEYRREYGVVG